MQRIVRSLFVLLLLAALWLAPSPVDAGTPAAPAPGAAADLGLLFTPSDRCMACHNGLVDETGADHSFGYDWRSTMMANAARDPYWQGAIRRETLDHPSAKTAIEDECSKCHMPMARTQANVEGRPGRVFAHLSAGSWNPPEGAQAIDGVSCAVCHQIQPDGLGEESSFVAGFVVDTTRAAGDRPVLGPHDVDAGRQRVMQSASHFRPEQADHVRSAEMCATCHTLITHSLGPDGEVIGELPEQVPYLEWLHSDFADRKTCADCHLVPVDGEVAISAVLPQPRPDVDRHVFRGGNMVVPGMLNRHRDELGTLALSSELLATTARTVEHLETSAASLSVVTAELDGGRLVADLLVENLAGHKLPTAYPSRRSWIHLTVTDGSGAVLFESGAFEADGSIAGNDNDEDGARYEPHHAVVERPDQVQIYEAILGGADGAVTTGLLTATEYLKDNRVPPRGFDKATAEPRVDVHGAAATDGDFVGGSDRVRYAIDVSGAIGFVQVRAELWYQPIGYRWAHNLGDYTAAEPARFVGYYEAAAGESAVVLSSDAASVMLPLPGSADDADDGGAQ